MKLDLPRIEKLNYQDSIFRIDSLTTQLHIECQNGLN